MSIQNNNKKNQPERLSGEKLLTLSDFYSLNKALTNKITKAFQI
jgi:hypothetical protein